MTHPIPVSVITGYLGAGKTTLLNKILSQKQDHVFAVIINEFGEIGIDGDLVVSSEENIYEMTNGCLCCSVRGDLIDTVQDLLVSGKHIDAILVETTGLADPAPVAQTFLQNEDIRSKTKLDSIITVADALHLDVELTASVEAKEQIAFADIVIMNKADLVDNLVSQVGAVRALNPTAEIIQSQHCDVDLSKLLDRNAFGLDRTHVKDPKLSTHTHTHHNHDQDVQSFSLEAMHPLKREKFSSWMQWVLEHFGMDLLRIKGILSFKDDDDRFVIQGVHQLVEGVAQRQWEQGELRSSRIVFIGRNLPKDIIEQGFYDAQK